MRLKAAGPGDHLAASRAWTVRVHLPSADTKVARCVRQHWDGDAWATVENVDVQHFAPVELGSVDAAAFFPLRGSGSQPAPMAGVVAQATVRVGEHAGVVVFEMA